LADSGAETALCSWHSITG